MRAHGPRVIILTLLSIAGGAAAQPRLDTESALTLWYREPAREWVEALPVGNGRLGGMVFGGPSEDRIQLNEQTVWSGDAATQPPIGPSIAAQLPAIRKLRFDGKYAEGEAAASRVLLTNGAIPKASYQTLGELIAARELKVHDDVVGQVEAALPDLAWPQIGADGRLMEWSEPFKEAEPGHRHMSHLYGLHPGHQFTERTTREYMAAARKTIEARRPHPVEPRVDRKLLGAVARHAAGVREPAGAAHKIDAEESLGQPSAGSDRR